MAVGAAPASVDPDVARLVERAQSGDEHAFAQLYDRYLDQVYGYVRRRVNSREVAEDLTGDVFLRAWRSFEKFQWQGVDLGAWLTTIARNRVHDHFKSAKFRLERSTDDIGDRDPAPGVDDPDRVAEAHEMARTLAAALDELKDEHREVVELRFVHDLSVSETAAVLGRSVGATKALQYRALRALSAIVRDDPRLSGVLGTGLTGLIMLLGMLR